jgi:hypothetical protein
VAGKNEQITLIESFEDELHKLFEQAIDARDKAQEVSSAIKELMESMTTKKLNIFKDK